jgi:hypothetical protein
MTHIQYSSRLQKIGGRFESEETCLKFMLKGHISYPTTRLGQLLCFLKMYQSYKKMFQEANLLWEGYRAAFDLNAALREEEMKLA